MPRITPRKFAHVVYRTRRFAAMIEWYQKVFGARVQHQGPALAFLTYDDEHHRFGLLNLDAVRPDLAASDSERGRAGRPSGARLTRDALVGVDHVAYTYASLDGLLTTYVELRAEGILPYWSVHHGMTVSLYYADPDGNQIELQVEVFPSNEQATDFMEGADFRNNPIGVEFDPDAWVAALESGVSAEYLLVRKGHVPMSPVRGTAGASEVG